MKFTRTRSSIVIEVVSNIAFTSEGSYCVDTSLLATMCSCSTFIYINTSPSIVRQCVTINTVTRKGTNCIITELVTASNIVGALVYICKKSLLLLKNERENNFEMLLGFELEFFFLIEVNCSYNQSYYNSLNKNWYCME